MNEQFKKFVKTGKVADYLEYKKEMAKLLEGKQNESKSSRNHNTSN